MSKKYFYQCFFTGSWGSSNHIAHYNVRAFFMFSLSKNIFSESYAHTSIHTKKALNLKMKINIVLKTFPNKFKINLVPFRIFMQRFPIQKKNRWSSTWTQSHYREFLGLDLGRMDNFPAFIASKSFGLWNHHIPQMKWCILWHILMYQKYMKY